MFTQPEWIDPQDDDRQGRDPVDAAWHPFPPLRRKAAAGEGTCHRPWWKYYAKATAWEPQALPA
jgi:hypothetical protein